MRRTIEIAALAVALLAGAVGIHEWIAARADLLHLQATLAGQKQLIDAADARERDRAAALKDTLAQIDALKRAHQTSAEIVRDLPKYISLPAPIALQPADGKNSLVEALVPAAPSSIMGDVTTGLNAPDNSISSSAKGKKDSQGPEPSTATDSSVLPSRSDVPTAPEAQIPAADLKPLYDFVQDCRACQAQLAAAKLSAADDASKFAALTRERDAAIQASKGGSIGRRIRRDIVWLLAGAAAGSAAICATGHCRP